jgi:tRNA dimethylallyltransferase
MINTTNPAVILIVGPTASGKSEAGYLLAKKLNGEIISADSMQVYRSMDVATAKPPPGWREDIPHHLIDIVTLSEEYSAGRFCQDARAIIPEILKRGKVPIVVGGTGMYVRALVKGMVAGAAADKKLRDQLNKELEEDGTEHLYEKLKNIDPVTAAAIDPRNPRRIIRALEVVMKLKKPLAGMQKQWRGESTGIENEYRCVMIGLRRRREDLAERINLRVEEMFRGGILDECRYLIEKGIENNKVALQALGYRDVIAYLRDEMSRDDAMKNIQRRTRNFAKRQMTWFRKEPDITWIDVDPNDVPSKIVNDMTRILNKQL